MSLSNKKILITGGAGFIGSHLCEKLLANDNQLTVIDNFDPFYKQEIKESNIAICLSNPKFKFLQIDICDFDTLLAQCKDSFYVIIHLAAKAGVRPSIENPIVYQRVNVAGTQNLLEFARICKVPQFVFASSSSVYGINPNIPWKESDYVLNPISPYASTKISGELLGHVYSHLYNIRFVALRFFTVFGPRQRPDLAIHLFANKILNEQPITMFGDGNTQRDYTYVDDIVDGVINACSYTDTMFEIFNLGNSHTVSLAQMIETIEQKLNKKAIIQKLPEQAGDVPITFSNIQKAKDKLNYNPTTSFEQGVEKFISWLKK